MENLRGRTGSWSLAEHDKDLKLHLMLERAKFSSARQIFKRMNYGTFELDNVYTHKRELSSVSVLFPFDSEGCNLDSLFCMVSSSVTLFT